MKLKLMSMLFDVQWLQHHSLKRLYVPHWIHRTTIKNHLGIFVWAWLCVLCSAPSTYMFISLPLPCGHNYCSYIVILHIGRIDSFFLFQNYLDSFRAFLLCSQRNLYTNVHSTITQNSHKLETSQMSFSDEWFNKPQYVYTMEHYSAVEGNEWPIHAAVWMDLNEMMHVKQPISKSYVLYYSIYITFLK